MCNTFTIRVPISLVPALLNDKENAAHLESDKNIPWPPRYRNEIYSSKGGNLFQENRSSNYF